jgi:glycosyltransferase involved in cell wall biosynthesis
MNIAVLATHIGSHDLIPSGQHGGGELHTFGLLEILNKHYNVTAVLPNGVYPAFDQASTYGMNLDNVVWKPVGDDLSWIRSNDVMISMSHSIWSPPICRRNILVSFFPQYPDWDVTGYDTIIANSQYTATWIKHYWGRKADVVYPPIPAEDIYRQSEGVVKKPQIVVVGRFFNVPGGTNKNHHVLLQAFQDLMRPDWELVFIGAVQNQRYYTEIKRLAGDDSRIKFLHDIPRDEYLRIMAESTLLWAATGYEAREPSSFEHFGVFAIEAMATGGIPIVYNGGGTPETGCLVWETPRELIESTQLLLNNPELLQETSVDMMGKAAGFDIQETAQALIDVIEKPIVINNLASQFKQFLDTPRPEQVKVGLISDSVTKTTGFGVVTKGVITGLKKMGFRVANFGFQDPHMGPSRLTPDIIERTIRDTLKQIVPKRETEIFNNAKDYFQKGPKDVDVALEEMSKAIPWSHNTFTDAIMKEIYKIEPCTIWRGCLHDNTGWDNLGRFLTEERPDIIYINYDFGNVRKIIDALRELDCDLPLVVYAPIEGDPVVDQILETIRLVRVLNGQVVLYTQAAVDQVVESGGPRLKYVHHGVNHAKFRPLSEKRKAELRFAVGFQNRMVLMTAGRNKKTKGFGTAIEVAQILRARGFDEFVWYFHTDPYENIPNSSLPLGLMVKSADLQNHIIFPPHFDQLNGTPYDTPIKLTVPDTDNISLIHQINFQSLTLIERMGICHAYVGLSQVEGWGLMPMEAAGCGVPIINIDDHGVQREVLGPAPMYLPPRSWSHFQNGARIPQIDPADCAQAILDLARDKELEKELVAASLKRHAEFTWEEMSEKIGHIILEQV